MKILIAGGSGFIGRELSKSLISSNHEVKIVSRSHNEENTVGWSGETFDKAIAEADAIINLAGVNLFEKRWDTQFKKEIEESRVNAVRYLARSLAKRQKPLAVFLQASAIGYYGSHNSSADYVEETPAGTDYLADTCVKWEEAANLLNPQVNRLVIIRTGVVLGHGGGALESMKKPLNCFVGGVLGSGDQWVSWVHIEDIVALFETALKNKAYQGVYNGTAPEPITHRDQVKSMAKHMNRPCLFPVPTWVVRLMLGEVADLVVNGQRVLPRRAQKQGFIHKFPTIESAFDNLF